MRYVLLLLAIFGAPVALAQNAADSYYDPVEMAEARAALKAAHGDQINTLFLGERLEMHAGNGKPETIWEAQGWAGGDIQKLWFKTEGEYEDGSFEEAEAQVLYSRAISAFWDAQAGLRYDISPDPSRAYLTLGTQGLAPYWFELDTQLFLSDKGDVSVRLEAEYEFRLTQRLILQPRVELNGAFSSDNEVGLGSGLSTAEAGLRLRYEIRRKFAPYFGVSWSRSFGKTKDLVRLAGGDGDEFLWVGGVRFWF